MSDEIKEGDLVMVVRGMRCCGYAQSYLGTPFIVTGFRTSLANKFKCKGCGNVRDYDEIIVEGLGRGALLHMLKKIDPPALTEESENKHELVT